MTTRSRGPRRRRTSVSALLLAFALSGTVSAGQGAGPAPSPPPAADARPLAAGTPVEREMAGGGADLYAVNLTSGQYLSLVVDQRGIDIVLSVIAPSGKPVVEVDSPNGTQGPEGVLLVTDETGAYRFGVRSLEKTAAAGRYEIRIVELRAATPNDAPLIEATGLYNQSIQMIVQGRFKEAVAPAEQSLAIREKVLGPDDPLVADALDQLGFSDLWLGDMATSEPLYVRALAIREKALGPDNRITGQSVFRLAALYLNKGEYAKSEQLYRRALAIYEKVFGPEDAQTASVLSEMGFLYQAQGDAVRAEPLHRRALAIREKTLGPNDLQTALSLANVAWVFMRKGEYATAEPLYERTLAIREKALGPDHPDVAETLGQIAWLDHLKGDDDKAIPLGERGLAILEKTLGPDHPNVSYALGQLAEIYTAKKDYAKAETTYLRGLAVSEKSYGPNHAATATALVNLGFLYNETGQFPKAEPLFRRALTIYEKALGPDSVLITSPLNDLAYLDVHEGKPAEAEPLYERVLAIREKALGSDHPDVGTALENLAALIMRTGDTARAVQMLARANDIIERNLDLNLAIGSERQKLLYLKTLSSKTDVTISLNTKFAPDDPAARRLALLTILRRKGRALDALVDSVGALRGRMNPEDRALLDRLTEARSRLASLVLKGAGRDDPARYRSEVKALEDELDGLEAEIGTRSAAFRAQTAPVTIEAVQAAIPAGAALVEFVRYEPVKAAYAKRGEEWDPPRYAAYVLGPTGDPKWADLGDAETIDKASEALRDALRDRNRTDVKVLARAVDEMVMRPVRALLGPARNVLLSPDGELNLIPFAALVDQENAYLVERYAFTYLSSGRDLLRLRMQGERSTGAVIFADPTFGGPARAGSERKLVIEEATTGAPRLYFGPLPGTAGEARALQAILPGATVLTKDAATETALKQVHAPSILHVATHGFFLQDRGAETAGGRQAEGGSTDVENPLLRAGLGLAGANLRASGDDDGVLTALEAASLDLWGTKLVVLSACDTGVGEVRNGEGVYGLRRALVIAGSESQVMSLWPVSDTGTRELMAGYYEGLRSGQGRGEALRQVQLRMLRSKDRRQPYYWASFIESGAWTSLDRRAAD